MDSREVAQFFFYLTEEGRGLVSTLRSDKWMMLWDKILSDVGRSLLNYQSILSQKVAHRQTHHIIIHLFRRQRLEGHEYGPL